MGKFVSFLLGPNSSAGFSRFCYWQTLSGMFKRASAGGARTPHLQAHDLWRHGLHALAPAALAASPQAPATPQ
jgi:hypothetical protein